MARIYLFISLYLIIVSCSPSQSHRKVFLDKDSIPPFFIENNFIAEYEKIKFIVYKEYCNKPIGLDCRDSIRKSLGEIKLYGDTAYTLKDTLNILFNGYINDSTVSQCFRNYQIGYSTRTKMVEYTYQNVLKRYIVLKHDSLYPLRFKDTIGVSCLAYAIIKRNTINKWFLSKILSKIDSGIICRDVETGFD